MYLGIWCCILLKLVSFWRNLCHSPFYVFYFNIKTLSAGFRATALVGTTFPHICWSLLKGGVLVFFCVWRGIGYSLEHVTVFGYSYNIDVT